jgi:hypothetical protein
MPAVPAISANFGDLLDPRFQRIFADEAEQLPDMLPRLFNFVKDNGRDSMPFSNVGGFHDFSEFTGTVDYDSPAQGYDTTLTPLQFASGFQVERALYDDDQYQIIDRMPRGLARAAQRTRQKHGARIFNNAASVDTYFYANTEGVALVSNSHTTTDDEASTATGFDNLVTTALSHTAVTAARIQFRAFRDAAGNRGSYMPNELLIPVDLYEVAFEITKSMGRSDTAENARNVHENAFTVVEWEYLNDSNNWFMMDSALRRQHLHWWDRVSLEFAQAEDLDTLIAKWRGYCRYANGHDDWRWVLGGIVS